MKIGNLSGATQIQIGFDYATTGGDEICIEGTQAQINAALKTLQTKIANGSEKVDISIDVQPGGMVYNPENGHYYEYVASSGITWTNAKAAAELRSFEGMTGYLATPTSAEENAFIADKVKAQAWIGASDAGSEGVWQWATGPETGTTFFNQPYNGSGGTAVTGQYSNWASGEPNDHGAAVGSENYAHYLENGTWNDYPNSSSSIRGYMVEYGGMPNDVPTVKAGVKTLTVYATEALGNVSMTVSDFEQAGVTGVTTDNLASINQVLSGKSAADVDTNPELQSVVSGVISAIAKIEDYNNGVAGVTLDVADYEAAGIIGVVAGNKDDVNSAIQALNTGGANTTAEIQGAVAQVRIETYADATDATGLEVPTVADYHALGIYAVDASNLAWVNSFALDAVADLADNTSEIELLVQEALEMKPLLDAVAKISAWADFDGTGTAPTLDDYVTAQLTGVDQYNLGMANALFAASTVGAGDTTPTGTQSEQQSVLTAAVAELSAYSKIVSYADNNGGPVPSITDYQTVGLTTFPQAYVDLLNAELVTNEIGRDEADEVSELLALGARIKITEYANANGFGADGVTPLTGDFVPTAAEWAMAGVTEFFDGTTMVTIDANNVEQVNDIMAMRYVGTGARIDVVDTDPDASTNETNLDYAGTVATLTDIQEAVQQAAGETVSGGNTTFGLRIASLNKIAAFADAVNGLSQNDYDAYLTNNPSLVPSASDYNHAGVLDLSESTGGISAALATAINNKLYTASATSAVNTAGELQPYVDAANEIVNKIADLATGVWDSTGSTGVDYVDLVYSFANGDFSSDPDAEFRVDNANYDFRTADRTGSMLGWDVFIDQIILGDGVLGVAEPTDTTYDDPQQAGVDNVVAGNGTDALDRGVASGDTEYFEVRVVNSDDNYQTTVATQWQGSNTYSANSNNINGDYEEHNEVLELGMNVDHPSYGTKTIRGPAIVSQESIILSEGDTVSFDWRSLYINDQYDVIGYLAPVDANGNAILDANQTVELLNESGISNGSSAAGSSSSHYDNYTTAWKTETHPITASEAGEYKFVFISGSWETHTVSSTSGGGQVGSLFWLDNIKVELAANNLAPFVFDGVSFDGTTVSSERAQQVFDRQIADGTGFSTTTASDSAPAVLGWKDDGSYGKEPSVLQSVRVASGDITGTTANQNVLPGWFDIEGWDEDSQSWVLIQSFGDTDTVATATRTLTTDSGIDYLEFDIASAADGTAFTGFRIKAYKSQNGDGTIEISELDFIAKAATDNSTNLSKDELEAIGITGVTTGNIDALNAAFKAQTSSDTVDLISEIQSLVDDVAAAFTKLENYLVTNPGADDNGNFTADGREVGVPTLQDYITLGLTSFKSSDGLLHTLAAEHIPALNEWLYNNRASFSDLYTEIAAEMLPTDAVNAVVGARIEAILDIAQLATVNPNSVDFTAAFSRASLLAGTPVEATDAMSVSGDGWTLSTDTIGADINNGTDQYAIGNILDGNGNESFEVPRSNLPVTLTMDFDNPTSVSSYKLNFYQDEYPTAWKVYGKDSSGAYTVLLDEVSDYSESSGAGISEFFFNDAVADVDSLQLVFTEANDPAGIAITEIDFMSSGAPNAGDQITLDLTLGSDTYTVTTTLTSESSVSGIAAALNASLPAYSGFVITSTPEGELSVVRADGRSFSVTDGTGAAGSWLLTSGGNAIQPSSTVSVAVEGEGRIYTVADFETAGVTGVSSTNIQATIDDLVQLTDAVNADTTTELQSVVNSKTAVFELLQFIADGELYAEVGETFNYARNDYDPIEVISSGYYLWDENESGSRPRTLDATYAFDGTTSTTANGWWVSEREDVGSGNVDHYGIYGRANYQAYIGYVDKDNSTGPTLLQSIGFDVYSTATLDGRVQGYDSAKGIWTTITSFATGSIDASSRYTIDLASQYGSGIEKVAYDGYRLVFDDATGNWGPRVDITELYINAKTVLPLATPETFATAGIPDVTDDNIAQIRKKVLEDTNANSTIDDITGVVSGVVAGLTSLKEALGSGDLSSVTATTYADVGIDGVDSDNVAAINAIAADRQANLAAGETLAVSDLQRIADDVSTNLNGLLSLATLMNSESTDSDKLTLAQTLLTAGRSYVPDLDGVNGTDAQIAIKKLLGFSSASPVTDLEGMGVVAKEIYANWTGTAGSNTQPDLGDPTDATHGFTPWEAFNGNTAGSAEGYASTAYVSSDRPASLGWFDSQKSQGASVISSFTIDSTQDKMPTVFDLYGYNADTEVWEYVQSYDIVDSYNHETSMTFEVDTFRAYSGYRLDMFAPSKLDETGVFPNPHSIASVDSDIVIQELTFNVDSSAVVVNAGLAGIEDASTLAGVLTAIGAATDSNATNTNTLAKVLAIAETTAANTISAHVADPVANPAPTLSDYRLLGVTTYDSGTSAIALDADNLAAINELVVEQATAFTGSDLQTLLDDASNVARLDAVAKIAAYAADDLNDPTTYPQPSVTDYEDLGIRVTSGELATVNGLIVNKDAADVDTIDEIADYTSPVVEFVGFDIDGANGYADSGETSANGTSGTIGTDDGNAATGDSDISIWLDVSDAYAGDIVELWVDGIKVATSAELSQGQIDSGTYKFVNDSNSADIFDMATYDTASGTGTADDDKVKVQLRVTNSGGTQIQELDDAAWDYQW
ncbi:C-type lectin domain-containing protein [Marinobacterium sp. xm-d-510]|uniref:C-type lectin domain-containing protein n=1 Tax=Marinobacterium sp. xm-d-510 TaxID=2497735 RepID=UPI0019DDCB99|nr:C-type lectin domain-containing protein [Marinobacterium sp. xm-d-510]NRP58418.1 Lectin C-type domain protein [Marinobacterium sp. xm-d-510]